MTLIELFEILSKPTTVHQDYIVKLKYKYSFEEQYTIENQILEYDGSMDEYIWLNDWNEGQEDVEVLGYVAVQDLKIVPDPSRTLIAIDNTSFITKEKYNMGTSALVKFLTKVDEEHTYELVNVRFHYDGYVDGVGHHLAKWLMEKRITNGIADFDRFGSATANGVEDLVAQYIRDNKNIYGIGNFYVTYPTTRCDYEYYVTIDDTQIGPCDNITIIDINKPSYYKNEDNIIFKGKPSELINFKEGNEDE